MIDRIRKRFLRSGSTSKRKYHLIFLSVVCLSKSQSGLDILNLERMNIALIAKWWFRFKDSTVLDKLKSILQDKYSSSGLKISRCYSLWSDIMSIKFIVDLGHDITF